MSEELWTDVDSYIANALIKRDASLETAVRTSHEGKLPEIQVSAPQAEFMSLLVQVLGARRILEIGTLGGFSAIAMARELPSNGYLLTMEYDPHHAEVATSNIAAAGLSSIVDVTVGAALDSLEVLAGTNPEPFDLFFIDADKEHNPDYFQWALRLSRLGSVIVVDNVVRDGGVVDATSSDAAILGTRKLYEVVGAASNVRATAIQTVGSKGYDGFLIARVVDAP